jgi:hypothetical protein
MTYYQVIESVFDELRRAEARYPGFPTDPLHALAVLGEEYGELTKAILQEIYEPDKQARDAVMGEAVQTAAMALRFLLHLDHYRFDRCSQSNEKRGMKHEKQTDGFE